MSKFYRVVLIAQRRSTVSAFLVSESLEQA